MEEVGAPVVIHQHLAARFHDLYPTAKKRALPFHSSTVTQQNSSNHWNPNSWNWDSSRFIGKQLQSDQVQLGSVEVSKEAQNSASRNPSRAGEEDENLLLKLGGGDNGGVNVVGPDVPRPLLRPNKRVRSGSPVGANYPKCQVDNCKEDLSTAKDYHRRHKVCEVHSKAGKALVGKQMQRFCQQCSRFHPLAEFDDEKRSCRRRLAGHNRRRRKTHPEDTTPKVLAPATADNSIINNDIINLLSVLTRAQANTPDNSSKSPSVPNKDQLIHILSKINSLPLQEKNLSSKLNNTNPDQLSSENQNRINGNASSTSTMDLLAVLSGAPSSDPCEIQSHPRTKGSDSEKSKSACVDQAASLPLQLFSPPPEDYRSMKLPSYSSSYPSEERSPQSSPLVERDLFPMGTSVKDDRRSNSEGEVVCVEEGVMNGCSTSLRLFGGSENASIQSSPYRAGYTSSGSDQSPSSQNYDARDRTGRIVFKLFDKDPSHLPGSLRTQIYNWLSNSPSEMESYIRPGCVVLSLYLSMPSSSWDQLERNLLSHVKSLVKDIDVDFWGSGRFFVHTEKQMASHKEGKIRLCKTWRGQGSPELISVSPVAVVGGQETSLRLRGRNLNALGTRVHCMHTTGCNIMEASSSLCQNTAYDEIILTNFKIDRLGSSVFGRCFVAVENSFKGSSFPVIIADSTICQELRLLEPDINGPRPDDEVLHFLDELGWLFQRKHNSCLFEIPDYRLNRFKFLLVFSVERDFCALVKTLLDIMVELNLGRDGLAKETWEMLLEVHLLNRAVKRRSRRMVDLLVRYSFKDSNDMSDKFVFVPNMAAPGGITPLHLAACISYSEDIIDALTNDPLEIGLHSWNSVLDANGVSPYAYAVMRNHHSYNTLVARKLADGQNGQITVPIEEEIKPCQDKVKERKSIFQTEQGPQSCSRCAAVAAYGYGKRFSGSEGLLQRPYIHSMLLVAAVCVCVCVFLRGHPYVGCVSPFAWDNLGFGTI